MWFAPQWYAFFWHLNFQRWSEHGVLCTFWLGNVLRATTACTFSTAQFPKVVRDCQFLTRLTSKRALRHNGVHFFDISTFKVFRMWGVLPLLLQNVLRATTAWNCSSLIWPDGFASAALASLLFRPSRTTNHWKKNTVNCDFPTFLRTASSFFPLFLFPDVFTLLFFSSLTLPTSAFPSVHTVGSLTSKLPSIMVYRCL